MKSCLCLCPQGMSSGKWKKRRHCQVCERLCSQSEASAERIYTLGLQPPLWKDWLGPNKGNVEFEVSCVASDLQSSDYLPSLSQKASGTAKGWERCIENVKDTVKTVSGAWLCLLRAIILQTEVRLGCYTVLSWCVKSFFINQPWFFCQNNL